MSNIFYYPSNALKFTNHEPIEVGDMVEYKREAVGVVTSINANRGVFVRFSGETSQLCPPDSLYYIGTIKDILK
jgi:hypothetical protein